MCQGLAVWGFRVGGLTVKAFGFLGFTVEEYNRKLMYIVLYYVRLCIIYRQA